MSPRPFLSILPHHLASKHHPLILLIATTDRFTMSSAFVPFDEQLYALASVTHTHNHCTTVPGTSTKEQTGHLPLLNDITLLLVTHSKSNVAAVSSSRRLIGLTSTITRTAKSMRMGTNTSIHFSRFYARHLTFRYTRNSFLTVSWERAGLKPSQVLRN